MLTPAFKNGSIERKYLVLFFKRFLKVKIHFPLHAKKLPTDLA